MITKDLVPHTSAPWQQDILVELLDKIEIKKDICMLDAGCGIGNNINTLKKYGSDITAFDISEKPLSYAKNKYKGVNFLISDLHNINLENDSFDIVISTEAIEHCHNPQKVISELYRVLCKNGYLILSSQNHLNLTAVIKFLYEKIYGKNWDAWGTHGHEEGFENYLTSILLEKYAKKAGFKVIKSYGADYLNAWMSWLPFIYRNYKILDKYPMRMLGRIPLIKYIGMDYFLLLKKE